MLSYKHEVFFEVARELSFTKASETLFVSQPAISKHIKDLEQQYQCRLFERKGNTILLTEAGKILYHHLISAIALSKQIEFDINNIQQKEKLKGELRLGASTTVALYIIPSVLASFRQANPEVRICLLNRNSENIQKALLNNEIDLGIIEGKKKMANVSSQYFLSDEVIAVCSRKSNLAAKNEYNLEEIKQIPIALREKGSGTLAAITHALMKHGIRLAQLKDFIRLGGTEALKNFLMADYCFGFLPKIAVEKELASGELVRMHFNDLNVSRQFYFIERQGDKNTGMNKNFIKFAIAHYNNK